MSRKAHIIHPEYPYHVTARAHSGAWFHVPIDVVWEIMSNYLFFIHHAFKVEIHAFVLMNNHFHLVLRTPQSNLSEAMAYFMRETSKEINRISGNVNQVYGNRYYRSLILKNLHFNHVYKYVYRNPVTAGICKNCEDYEYSTLYGLLGRRKFHIPMAKDLTLLESDDFSKTLQWLNTTPSEQNYIALKKALHRKELKFAKNKWVRDRHTLEMTEF